MTDLISIQSIRKLQALRIQETQKEILALNEELEEHSLVLTPAEAMELAETRTKSLRDNGIVEIGGGALLKLIRRFSTSEYVDRGNFASVLHELTELFYYIKSETADRIHDEVLIDTLFRFFETSCGGDVTLLCEREADTLLRYFNAGRLKDKKREYHRGETAPYELEKDDARSFSYSGFTNDNDEE